MFMATGGTDHLIRVYYLGAETPVKVSEMDAHTVRTKTLWLHPSGSTLFTFIETRSVCKLNTCLRFLFQDKVVVVQFSNNSDR